MFTKVSVLIPTRQRPERLDSLLTSFAHEKDAELVFRVDDDDSASQDRLRGYRVVVGPRHGGYASMPLFFNELYGASTGDVLMCGNDDMVFQTPGWPEAVLETANQFPDGLFDIGVMTLNETHYPFSIVSRKAADRMGFLWDPRIFWGDIFLRDVMAAFGRCVMLSAVQVDHDWAGNRPDGVFLETRESKGRCEGDSSYWSGVHLRAVNEAIDKLRGLLT